MASASNSDPPEPPPQEETRNLLELPRDLMATILHRVGAIEILANAQMVCTTWHRICKEPAMWRVIDLRNSGDIEHMGYDPEKMAKHAVDLSCGQLVDINIEHFGTDELLEYIADRSSQLRRLRLVRCNKCYVLTSALKKLPLLEELHLYYTAIPKDAIETAGQCCPKLKSFKLNTQCFRRPHHIECDEEALSIAENMPQLCHLQLFGNRMTNNGLRAILDGCSHLESLDLRQCFNVNLKGDLAKRCTDQIKDMRHPFDSTDDYGFDAQIHDCESSDGDSSGFSEIDISSDPGYYDDDFYEYGDYDDYTLLFDDYTELFDY